jgi:hypothetical protein
MSNQIKKLMPERLPTPIWQYDLMITPCMQFCQLEESVIGDITCSFGIWKISKHVSFFDIDISDTGYTPEHGLFYYREEGVLWTYDHDDFDIAYQEFQKLKQAVELIIEGEGGES